MSTRNVVLLGEVGSGKSSIINLIAGDCVAKPSNDANGGTRRIMCYTLNVSPGDTQINLWDTPGWDGADGESTSQGVNSFLQNLHATEGIHLLLFCMPKGRATKNLLKNYKDIYSERAWCETPTALAITRLERMTPNMHNWWEVNGTSLENQGLQFHAHACVTTVDDIEEAKQVSQNRLRKLVLHHISTESMNHHAFCPGPEDGVPASITGVREASWSAPICFSTIPWRTQKDVLIIVTGPVGSGKSSFISKLTGIPGDSVGVGHSLIPCTTRVRAFGYGDQQSGKRVILLDVPGFPHPSQSGKILNMIVNWLKNAYKRDVPLGGILYLHSVAHRFAAVSPVDFSILGGKCGESIMQKLSLVTTMWNDVPDEHSAAELEKCEKVWQSVLHPGEAVPRYLNTCQSAREIIQPLLSS
ncbi:hypothetical protein EDC04DRAFT_87188 [Pisolithus marmoratus]|nr:hypothetical protein EDC04DRAFT_87188 [Pisolithus marmoratus]